MSDQEKIISSLKEKGLLDEPSVKRLRNRLKRKLKTEAEAQKKEITSLKVELVVLKNHLAG